MLLQRLRERLAQEDLDLIDLQGLGKDALFAILCSLGFNPIDRVKAQRVLRIFANKQPQDAMKRHLTSSLGPCKRVRAEESAEEGEEEEDDVDDVEDEEEEEEEGAEPAEAVSDNDKRVSENDKRARLLEQELLKRLEEKKQSLRDRSRVGKRSSSLTVEQGLLEQQQWTLQQRLVDQEFEQLRGQLDMNRVLYAVNKIVLEANRDRVHTVTRIEKGSWIMETPMIVSENTLLINRTDPINAKIGRAIQEGNVNASSIARLLGLLFDCALVRAGQPPREAELFTHLVAQMATARNLEDWKHVHVLVGESTV